MLDHTKLKALADVKLDIAKTVKLDIAKTIISVYNRGENIVGKGENAGYQQFLLFPQCFQNIFF